MSARARRGAWSWAGMGAVVLWGTLQAVFILVPPLAAVPLNLAIGAAFVWWFVTRPEARRDLRRRATLRLRAPSGAAPWIAVLAPILVAHVLAYLVFVPRLIPLPDPDPGNLLEQYLLRPFGWLGVLTMVAVIAPLLEEFLFRGWMQRSLERRYAPAVAIVVTALVFALVHFDSFGFAIRLSFAVLVGYLAYATRSVWPGVVLHGAYNAGLMAASGAAPDLDEATLTRWAHTPSVFWPTLLLWIATGVLLAWLARGMARTARTSRRFRAAGITA